jgi:hypothetical protein
MCLGENKMSKANANLQLHWLEFAILKVLLSTRLPLHPYSILFGQPKLFNLPKCFFTFLEANNLQGAKVLHIHSSIAILVGLCECFGDWPFYVWATHVMSNYLNASHHD